MFNSISIGGFLKRFLAAILSLTMILSVSGCANTANSNRDDSTSIDAPDWDFINERAEAFVAAAASGDFDAAAAMFDETMLQVYGAEGLQEGWATITATAGDFIGIHDIQNAEADGYYISGVIMRHADTGFGWNIVFSEDGLIAGLYTGGTMPIPAETHDIDQVPPTPVLNEGFTDYPIVVGEETSYPLNGILSMPNNTSGMVPAVVLVHGSGPQDMDLTIFSNKPFRDIAEHLAANGIAVIRYDKRTFAHGERLLQELGGSATVFHETIEDAILAAEILKADARIDENRVYIAGISMGAMLAPRIHAEGGNFAGIISLAGSPRSIHAISYRQLMLTIELMEDGEEKDNALELSERASYDAAIAEILNLPDEEAKNTPVGIGGVSAYYYKDWDRIPTSDYVETISIPFLIMQGSADFQVFADEDFVAWQELLAGRENAAFKLYEGLNHLFIQSSGWSITDFQEEYSVPGHVDGQVLADIAEWIKSN